jgi:hypothetical protein
MHSFEASVIKLGTRNGYSGVPEVKVSILGGHSTGHSKQKVSEIELFHYTVHCTDEQHAMSSHALQSPLMLTVEFSKMYYTI